MEPPGRPADAAPDTVQRDNLKRMARAADWMFSARGARIQKVKQDGAALLSRAPNRTNPRHFAVDGHGEALVIDLPFANFGLSFFFSTGAAAQSATIGGLTNQYHPRLPPKHVKRTVSTLARKIS